MEEAKFINHFSHQHQLKLYKEQDQHRKNSPWSKCHLCNQVDLLAGFYSDRRKLFPMYGCKECGFFIHKSCAKLEQKLSHPFHPKHPLHLQEIAVINQSSSDQQFDHNFQCHACGISTSPNFIYHCSECKFNLDFSCIQLKPHKIFKAQTSQNSHQHPLFVCKNLIFDEFETYCSFCQSRFYPDDEIYVCLDCKNLLHELCALPPEIMHQFHLEHPLRIIHSKTGVYHGKEFKCNACSRTCPEVFHCSQCEFSLDLDCATLIPTSKNPETNQDLQDKHVLSHPHLLIQCDKQKKTRKFYCSGCRSLMLDSIFVCLQCGILLESSCTELPPEIIHSFHPLHHLKLAENRFSLGEKFYTRNDLECRGCLSTIHDFFYYVCLECKFYLDTRCASISAQLVESKAHRHPLAFLGTKPHKDFHLWCKTCEELCEKNFFHCVKCKFGFHLNCYQFLPPVIKHDCHCDPLMLMNSRIKDMSDQDSDEEFYCHACEEIRNLDEPTYYCKVCHFVAHTHCVVSEILHFIEKESAAPCSAAPSESKKSPLVLSKLLEAPSEYNPPSPAQSELHCIEKESATPPLAAPYESEKSPPAPLELLETPSEYNPPSPTQSELYCIEKETAAPAPAAPSESPKSPQVPLELLETPYEYNPPSPAQSELHCIEKESSAPPPSAPSESQKSPFVLSELLETPSEYNPPSPAQSELHCIEKESAAPPPTAPSESPKSPPIPLELLETPSEHNPPSPTQSELHCIEKESAAPPPVTPSIPSALLETLSEYNPPSPAQSELHCIEKEPAAPPRRHHLNLQNLHRSHQNC